MSRTYELRVIIKLERMQNILEDDTVPKSWKKFPGPARMGAVVRDCLESYDDIILEGQFPGHTVSGVTVIPLRGKHKKEG